MGFSTSRSEEIVPSTQPAMAVRSHEKPFSGSFLDRQKNELSRDALFRQDMLNSIMSVTSEGELSKACCGLAEGSGGGSGRQAHTYP